MGKVQRKTPYREGIDALSAFCNNTINQLILTTEFERYPKNYAYDPMATKVRGAFYRVVSPWRMAYLVNSAMLWI